jgi:hypothetical protein
VPAPALAESPSADAALAVAVPGGDIILTLEFVAELALEGP